jgi:FkbM family methyltransferase
MTKLQDLSTEDRFVIDILIRQAENRAYFSNTDLNKYHEAAELYWTTTVENGYMKLNKVKMPDIRWFVAWYGWPQVYFDSIFIHHFLEDDYSLENRNILENLKTEGAYCTEKCMVKKGDIVIDAGSYIGDWAATASVMGGKVYAFEPCDTFKPILNDTAMLNNFTVVNCGLGDENTEETLYTGPAGAESMDKEMTAKWWHGPLPYQTIKIVKLDDFVIDNDIKSIDFIKCDIEGYENNLLLGASKTIKEFHPNLAFRTYHRPGDRELLTKTILDIDRNYDIEYGNKTLYATVR